MVALLGLLFEVLAWMWHAAWGRLPHCEQQSSRAVGKEQVTTVS